METGNRADHEPVVVNRRDLLGITLGAGASLALTPELLRALQTARRGGG